ncbi:MAG: thymidine phosphorylase [bacterium]
MNLIDLIAKKRDGKALSPEELQYLITGYVNDGIPDYQMSAFLMAVYFQGMTFDESAALTQIMRDSGKVLNLTSIPGVKADKHSTGGVGDKVSLVLAPLLACAGLVVPMISGRALAHTGGTLDKLEAIPGFKTDLDPESLRTQLQDIGVVLIGQTKNLCPADKKMYALRDATATVNSIPLITASILSKKMAEGIDVLVLDVKAGSGAIFDQPERAWALARSLVKTAEKFDLKTAAYITAMEQPLGNAVGNWLETREAIETLKGAGPADLTEVTLTLATKLLVLGGLASDEGEGRIVLENKLHSGEAFERFLKIVEMQGGDCAVVEKPETYPEAKYRVEIAAPTDGLVAAIHARQIGVISMALGAGRETMADGIDYTSGIYLHKKVGDVVRAGDTLAEAFSSDLNLLEKFGNAVLGAFRIAEGPVKPDPLILGYIDFSGEKHFEP